MFKVTEAAKIYIRSHQNAFPGQHLLAMVTWAVESNNERGHWIVGLIERERVPDELIAKGHATVQQIEGIDFVIDGPNHFLDDVRGATLDHMGGRLVFIRSNVER